MALTDKQRRFVAEYLIDLNATQAAIRAGYSKKTAHVIGPENLGKPAVAQAVKEAFDARLQKTELTQQMVIDGLLSEAQQYGEGASHSARVSAWGLLGKHQGMFSDKVQLTGANGGPLQVMKVTVRGVKRD